jgi:phospholipid/cholesterol/gamma-HCH transport system substrate-binding protein
MADRDDDDDVPPPPIRRGRSREMWLGFFVLVALVGGLGVLFTMTDPAFFRGRYIVSTELENAGGIRKGDAVRLKGVVIGRILSFTIDLKNERVAMRIEIEGEYQVPKDSSMEIRAKNVYGEMAADILPGASTEMLKTGDFIPGRLVPSLLEGGAIAEKVNDITERAKKLLSDKTTQGIEQSTVEMQALLKELGGMANEQRKELSALSKSLRKSAEGIEGAATRPELQSAIKRMDELTLRMDEVAASFKRSSSSLEVVSARIERGEGTLGKLTKDEALYKNLNEAVENMNKLVVDIREHPKRYVKLSFF